MGLDMYIRRRDKETNEEQEIGYFRKHSDLHGYMEELYIKNGGVEEFNCVPLLLPKEELIKIRELAKLELLHGGVFNEARGFFWGESTKEDWKETVRIFDDILRDTDFEKEEIYYDSWW